MRRLLNAILCTFMFCVVTNANAAWHEVKTENFTIRGDASLATLEKYAVELEQYRVFLGVVIAGRVPPPEPVNVPVYVMASERSFHQIYPNKQAAGVYTRRIGSPIFISNAARSDDGSLVRGQRKDSSRSARQTIKHEYMHHFTYINGPTWYPIWYSEGIADYFSTFEVNDESATVGQLLSIRGSWLVNDRRLPWQNVFSSILTWTGDTLRTEDISKYYAQSWLAVHYILNTPGMRKKALTYLSLLEQGLVEENAAFETAFGESKSSLGKKITKYLKSNKMPVQTYSVGALPVNTEYESRKLDGWEETYAEAWAQRFFARDKESRATVAAKLEQVRAQQPNFVPAMVELAHVRILERDRASARALVEMAARQSPEHADVLVLQGILASAVERRGYFDRARKADPQNARAHYEYAKTYRGQANEEALSAAILAMRLSAEQINVPILVGELLIELEYYDDARTILRPISRWARSGASRARAAELLALLP